MSTFYVDELRFYRHENVEMSINCDFIDIIEKFYEIPVRTACVSGRSEGGFTTEAQRTQSVLQNAARSKATRDN